jgi:antitoxin component HigA of HigAB toxin-antitoxin module
MCDTCKTLQKQLERANNYYVSVCDELGKLAKVAGLQVKSIAKLDALAAIKEVTASYKKALDAAIEKAVTDEDESEIAAKLNALPEAWQENLAWIEQTEFEPADIDRMVELLDLLGLSGKQLQYVLCSNDMSRTLSKR